MPGSVDLAARSTASSRYPRPVLERMPNQSGTATLRVEPGRVAYDQTYTEDGVAQNVVQNYAFRAADVRTSGPDRYQIALAFQSIAGDTDRYSPDRSDVSLVAQRVSPARCSPRAPA